LELKRGSSKSSKSFWRHWC